MKIDQTNHYETCHLVKCDFCDEKGISCSPKAFFAGDKTSDTHLNILEHIKSFHKVESHYEVEKKIGSGGFGVVHLGKNIKTKNPVAIKLEPQDNKVLLLENEFKFLP